MSRRRWRLTGLVLGAAILLVGIWLAPLRSQAGTLDTTTSLCLGQTGTTVKRYHLLLGQWHDYQLVRAHLVSTAPAGCGQRASVRLYL